MTEMEAPNWVLKRAQCNLEGIFDALYQRVQDDVVEINKLSSKRRRNHKFDTECTTADAIRTFRVSWYEEDNLHNPSAESVVFTRNTASITFHQTGSEKVSIISKWNESEMICDLFVRDRKYELWEISQMALGSFFFRAIGD